MKALVCFLILWVTFLNFLSMRDMLDISEALARRPQHQIQLSAFSVKNQDLHAFFLSMYLSMYPSSLKPSICLIGCQCCLSFFFFFTEGGRCCFLLFVFLLGDSTNFQVRKRTNA